MKTDFLIVGAGFAGAVLAERIASQLGKKVLVVEARPHIGGNCFDYYSRQGILVHKYGPHYFHTNDKVVFDYLSGFTDWHYLFYKIHAIVDGQPVPLPVNMDTINRIYNYNYNTDECNDFYAQHKKQIKEIKNSEDVILTKLGKDLYEKIYKSYTLKQWGLDPKELDASVCGRIPVRNSRDPRYFTDKYQAMPKYGYSRLFQALLKHPNIKVLLNTHFEEIKNEITYRKLIYTGPIDEFFEEKFGKLPYRSLRFEHEHIDREYYQTVVQVNYPFEYDFTRVVEIKHVTGQKHPKTTIVREYPMEHGDPFYPVPAPENRLLYDRYRKEADKLDHVYFIGRLAQYQYLNMDQVVAEALILFQKIVKSV